MPTNWTTDPRYDAGVARWLLLCIALVFLMVVVGGITRLTDSGLSMVDWRPLLGTLPPLSEQAWQRSFEQYQQYPQFQQTFPTMTLAEYKGIFFWEYVHRLLGRVIGLVFVLPLVYFWLRGRLSTVLKRRLLIALVLGGAQGVMGWYMVMSGLIDVPRVSHLRLTAHLCLALLIMCYLFWLLLALRRTPLPPPRPGHQLLAGLLVAVAVVQVVYGALVAGLRAGYLYNTFPKMGDQWVADGVYAAHLALGNFVHNPVTVQFVHRWLAMLFLGLVLAYWLQLRRDPEPRRRNAAALLFVLTLAQVLLGIYTLVNGVPLGAGVMHQGGAAALLLALVWVIHGQTGSVPVFADTSVRQPS
jgi:cytochrome c oxidase assembly protein subunit 15